MSDASPLSSPSTSPTPAWARGLPTVTNDGDLIVYGPRPLAPRVTDVEALDGYALRVTFETGAVRCVDCRPFLDNGVFQELRDEHAFRAVQPINSGGGIGWASGADLSRDTLFRVGEPV